MIKKPKNIIIYYIDNDVNDIKEFTSNFKPKFKHEIKYNTSIPVFYNTLKQDIENNKDLKIIIINSYIKSKSLNTNTATEVIPLIRHLDKNIKIIVFSKENNYTFNMSDNFLKASDFVKRNDTFFYEINAIINKYITEAELEWTNLLFRFSCAFLIIIIIIIILVFFLLL